MSTAFGLWCCWQVGTRAPLGWLIVGALITAVVAVVMVRLRSRAPIAGARTRCSGPIPALLCWVVIAGLAGLALAWCQYGAWDDHVQALGPGRYGAYEVVVTDLPRQTRYEMSVRATVVSGWARGTVVSLTSASSDALAQLGYGSRARVVGLLAPVRSGDWYGYAAGQAAQMRVVSASSSGWAPGLLGIGGRAQMALSRAIWRVRNVETEARALLLGLVTGDRIWSQRTGIEDQFRAAGVSHILSVSGSHLAVVAAAIVWLVSRLWVSRWASTAAVLSGGLGFTLATGGQSAAWRALGMLAMVGVIRLTDRRADAVASVALIGAALLAGNALAAVSIGTLLSLTAVLGMILFSRRLSRRLGAALGVTLGAQLGTYPISLAVFGTVAPYAVIANLVVVPLSSVALVLGLLGAGSGALFPGLLAPVAELLIRSGAVVAGWAVRFAALVSALPGAACQVPAGLWRTAAAVIALAAGATLYCRWPAMQRVGVRESVGPPQPTAARKQGRDGSTVALALALVGALALAAISLVIPLPSAVSTVTFLNVGQGDAAVIRSGGRVALIDTGPDAGRLWWQLVLNGVWRVDTLVLTHDHADHVGGVEALKFARVVRVVVADGAQHSRVVTELAAALGAEVDPVSAGDTLNLGGVELHVLGPSGVVTDPSANESCLVVAAVRQNQTTRAVVVGGDAESAETLAAITAWDHPIGVLKVGHHGSDDSVTTTLLARANPLLAVISVGAENTYGHPTASTLAILARANVPVHRTDRSGSITLKL